MIHTFSFTHLKLDIVAAISNFKWKLEIAAEILFLIKLIKYHDDYFLFFLIVYQCILSTSIYIVSHRHFFAFPRATNVKCVFFDRFTAHR